MAGAPDGDEAVDVEVIGGAAGAAVEDRVAAAAVEEQGVEDRAGGGVLHDLSGDVLTLVVLRRAGGANQQRGVRGLSAEVGSGALVLLMHGATASDVTCPPADPCDVTKLHAALWLARRPTTLRNAGRGSVTTAGIGLTVMMCG